MARFEFLAEELWPIAEAILATYTRRRFKVEIEKALTPDSEYRPTFIFRKGYTTEIIEVTKTLQIGLALDRFIEDCISRREPVSIWICVPASSEPSRSIREEEKHRRQGIGIYYVNENKEAGLLQQAVECHMRFRPEPGPAITERIDRKIREICSKFNSGSTGRLDALRDLAELVESTVRGLGEAAHRLGKLTDIARFRQLDFAGKLNYLHHINQPRIISTDLFNDLNSFRGARNLSDHPRTASEERRLATQFIERMAAGVRLLREIDAVKRQL